MARPSERLAVEAGFSREACLSKSDLSGAGRRRQRGAAVCGGHRSPGGAAAGCAIEGTDQRRRDGDPQVAERGCRSGVGAGFNTVALGGQPAIRASRKSRRGARAFRPLLLPDIRVVTMAGSVAPKSSRRTANAAEDPLYDRELDQFPPEMRWREWMLRVEAVISASAEPVSRETLARVVGKGCSIDLLIDDG